MIGRIISESSIDYKEKFGPVIFTSGCNFKCGYCHNPELIKIDEIGEEKVKELTCQLKDIKAKADSGWYNGICITGGEPCLHKNLPSFISKLKNLGLAIKIDTNGSYPEVLAELIDYGLVDYIALDIKASPELYSEVTGVNINIKNIEESIKIISESGIKHEFRTTVAPIVPGRWMTNQEIEEMVNWVRKITGKRDLWVLQTFVARNLGEILNEKFSIEKLPAEMRETPKHVLERMKGIIERDFECELK
jgi:pyruvate formate lyase activating enzyme